jgi:hypothetical protein
VKFREAHIANNAKLLKTYGYILQDLGTNDVKESPNEKVKAEYEKLTASESNSLKEKVVVELLNDITVTEPVKRGRKPKQ